MGIQGLLPFLDKASEKINIKSLKNTTVAIDSYCWLHKGAFSVGDKLVRGEETYVHILYCLKYVNMLLSHNIKPILVFDGRHLPAKAETEAKRRESRKNAKERGVELMRLGNHKDAQNHFRRCVDITHEMALQLIQTCRSLNVDCVVAPYEADAQLAYLNKIGLAEYVITEDSDLTLFGCRKILFKLDLTGNCVLVDSDKLHVAMDCQLNKFTMDKFRLMCILSGCDYVESLHGIGLAKACKFVMKTEETDIMRALDKIPAYLNMRHLVITDEYKTNVLRARATFLHMVVFDPRRRKQVRLNEIEEYDTNIDHCCNAGEIIDDTTALNLAVGNLNPFSMKQLDNWHPDQKERPRAPEKITTKGFKVAKHASMWQRDYRFTVSLNHPVSKIASQHPNFSAVKKPNVQQKRAIQSIKKDDEKLPTESQNDDLVLNQYIAINEPSQKRFKEEIEENSSDMEYEDKSAKDETTPNRNPFKKTVICKDETLSPTRISKENNSLVKNQSPVKRIDYSKLEKLSRFNRTVIPKKGQMVISRFFSNSIKPKTEIKAEPVENSESENKVKRPSLKMFELETPNPSLYFDKSSDSGFSPNTEESLKNFQNDPIDNNSENELSQENQRSILDKFKFALKEKMDDCDHEPMESSSSQEISNKTDSETNELPLVLSDNESEAYGSQKSAEKESTKWPSASQKSKTGTKTSKTSTSRPKKKLSNIKTSNNLSDTQSRLSMFGFQKKTLLKR